MLVYRPSKTRSLTSTKGGFTPPPTASIVGLDKKLGTTPQIGQPSCCGLGREPFFSEVVALSITIDDFMKRLPCTWTAHRKRTWGVHGLTWEAYMSCCSSFPLHGVHQFELPRLSDMSNRLFVAVMK
jgi:hypothetical protein